MPASQETEEREQRLQEALKAYRSGLSEYNSIRKAAAAHGISWSTLGDYLISFFFHVITDSIIIYWVRVYIDCESDVTVYSQL